MHDFVQLFWQPGYPPFYGVLAVICTWFMIEQLSCKVAMQGEKDKEILAMASWLLPVKLLQVGSETSILLHACMLRNRLDHKGSALA